MTLAVRWPRSLKLAVAVLLAGASEEDAAPFEEAASPPTTTSGGPSIEGVLFLRRKPESSYSTGCSI